jgi:D-amino-acid oxidase
MRVTVVGAGVIGLTCAVRLAEAGHTVTVLTADPVTATTSAAAAAIWYPYRVGPRDAVARWAAATYEVFVGLVDDAAAGVRMRVGRELGRDHRLDLSSVESLPGMRRLTAAEMPAGCVDGARFTVPVIDTSRYLPWLVDRLVARGGQLRTERVDSLAAPLGEGTADRVVNATGLASRRLCGDSGLYPIRGQVVRVANPGLTDWLLDEHHPDGMVYVVPRGRDVVCGGVAEESESLAVDPVTADAVLARCRAAVPALADAPVLSHAVGLRPCRDTVRLAADDADPRIVHCYGHGGAGVTLSWGCADHVVSLLVA